MKRGSSRRRPEAEQVTETTNQVIETARQVITQTERTPAMVQEISPIAVRPWTLNGISERMIVSHYENNYGSAVRTLNAVRGELATLTAGAPGYRIRALKREELIAMGSVVLHELYFGN